MFKCALMRAGTKKFLGAVRSPEVPAVGDGIVLPNNEGYFVVKGGVWFVALDNSCENVRLYVEESNDAPEVLGRGQG